MKKNLNTSLPYNETGDEKPCEDPSQQWGLMRDGQGTMSCLPSSPHHSCFSGLIIHIQAPRIILAPISLHPDSCHRALSCSWRTDVQTAHLTGHRWITFSCGLYHTLQRMTLHF